MSIEKFNVKNGLSVGIPAVSVIDSAGNATLGTGLFTGAVTGSQFKSVIADGTAPFIVASTTKVVNLNADQLDGCTVNDSGNGSTDIWTASKILQYSNSASGTVVSVTAGNGMTQTGTSSVDPTLNIESHAGSAGAIGTVVVGTDNIGVALGDTSTVAAAGNDARFDRTLVFSGDVSGTGASSGTITLTVADDSHNHSASVGNFTVGGDLIVNGTTTTVNSTETTLINPILSIGGSGEPVSVDDNKDRGIRFYWNDTNSTRAGFFGFDDSVQRFTFIPHAEFTNEVASGVLGDVQADTFYGNLTGMATSASTVVTNANLNGEATSVGNTVTLTNDAVIAKTLTGFTVSGGASAVTSSDTILTALQKCAANASAAVSTVSVVTANGFAGTVANATTTPAITLTTSVSGITKGNGSTLSAAVVGTDYAPGTSSLGTGIVKTTTGTGVLSVAEAADFPTLNQSTTGNADTATTAGTVTTAAQPAITSVGTLTSLDVAGTVTYGSASASVLNTYVLTTTSTSASVLASFPAATYRSVQFGIQGVDATGSKFYTSTIVAIHDGSAVTHTEFGTIVLGSSVGTFDVQFGAGNVSLIVNPTSTNSTVFKVTATLTKI